MIDKQTLDEIRQLALVAAPELRQAPLYIVDGDTTFRDLPDARSGGCLGWAYTHQGIVNIPLRERINEWVGAGPIISLHEGAIRDEYAADDFDAGLRETLIHEIAHCLPTSPYVEIEELADIPPETVREHQLAKLATWSDTPVAMDTASHDHKFVRRVLHCWYRGVAAGWSIPIYRLFGGDCPVFTQPPHFLVELMGEMIAMREATFAEIEAATPPKGFTEQWAQSTLLHAPPLKETK